MTDEKLIAAAKGMVSAANAISHPLIPGAVRVAIKGAAEIVQELVYREVKRNAKGE